MGNVNDLTPRAPARHNRRMTPTDVPLPTPHPAARAAPPRAVLFDFDGVIADTENVHVASWQRTLALLGWTVDDAACTRSMELDDRAFLAEIFARRGVEGADVAGWVRRKQELALMMLRDAPKLYPGVRTLVGRLSGRVALGVVTTTTRANVEAVLNGSGLPGAFPLVVAKEDVAAPKPDPEGYRLAVASLGLAPYEVLALEDSPAGLAAARAAGVGVVAVGHRRPEGDWSADVPFVPDLTRTVDVLRTLGLA